MKQWIFSIVITVILISVFLTVLPNSKNGAFVKSILHVILTFVIVKPLFHNNVGFDNVFNFNFDNIQIQQDFIDNINHEKIENIKKNCIKLLENNGIKGSDIDVSFLTDENHLIIIKKVSVNLQNSVIISSDMNIDIISRTKSLISNNLGIKEDMVEVYV